MTMIPSFQGKMVKMRQQAGELDLVQRRNYSKKILRTLQPVVGGIDPTPRRILLGSKSRVNAIIELEKWEKSNPL